MKVSVDGQCLSSDQTDPAIRRFVWQVIASFAHSSAGVEIETLTLDRDVAGELRRRRIQASQINLPPPARGLAKQTYAQRVNRAFRDAWLDSPPDLVLLPDLLSPEVAFLEPFGGLPIVAILGSMASTGVEARDAVGRIQDRLHRLRQAGAWFLVTSLVLRDWLSKSGMAPPERIETLPPPVDLQRFARGTDGPEASSREGAFVLTLACDQTLGALETVFRAFGRLGGNLRRHALVVAADPDDARAVRTVRRAAREAKLPKKRWRFEPDDDATLARLLHSARVFVYPAAEDHIGAPLLSALAAGCPVVCSETGALPELAGTAALTGPIDAAGLRERLGRILRNESERDGWAAKGPARAEKFSARQCASRLLQTFHQERRPPVALSGDLRIGYVSPFPPEAIGAAQYSKRLAPELREYCDIDLFTTQEDAMLDPVLKTRFHIFPADDLPQRYRNYDLVVYTMAGRQPFCRRIFDLLCRHPGVVILHDVDLYDFFRGPRPGPVRGLGRGLLRPGASRVATGVDPFRQEMACCYGQAGVEAAERDLAEGRRAWPDEAFLNNRITRRSRAVAVHSRWAARRLLENDDPARILRLRHGAQVDPQYDQVIAVDFRERVLPPATQFLIVAAGRLDFERRLDVLLRATAQLVQKGLAPALALVGEQPADIRRRLDSLARDLGIAERVVSTGRVAAHDAFLAYVAEADVVVDMRSSRAAGPSGVAMDALALGRPLIVADVPAAEELPRDAALRVKIDDLELPSLVKSLEMLHERPEVRTAMSQAARKFVAEEAAWPIVAREFCQFLYETARRYPYMPPEV
jgi:glycosyltransferase involved in cell wall biosynthesis